MTFRIFEDVPEDIDIFHIFNFCRNSCVLDLDHDDRLDWVQPYWERNEQDNSFTIHVGIFYPDRLVFDREYTEQLDDIFYDEEINPNPIRGVVPVDIDGDDDYEILLALQGQPLRVIDQERLEVLMISDLSIPDEIDSTFEIGHFNDPQRLQVLFRENDDITIFNLPENWRAPYLTIENNAVSIPQLFSLYPPYPNPFNSSTTITYNLPLPGDVTFNIFDNSGRNVEQLKSGWHFPGEYRLNWNASDYPAGVYLVSMKYEGGSMKTRKMILMR